MENFYYLVALDDGEYLSLLICKKNELVNLLLALDDNYKLMSVEPLGDNVSFDYKDFIKGENNLEVGR